MDKGLRNGQMGHNISGTGSMTRLMGMESCSMQIRMSMKVNGWMIKRMVKVYTLMLMVQGIMESGKRINSMALE